VSAALMPDKERVSVVHDGVDRPIAVPCTDPVEVLLQFLLGQIIALIGFRTLELSIELGIIHPAYGLGGILPDNGDIDSTTICLLIGDHLRQYNRLSCHRA
jgi:hypothetical protein